MEKFISFRSIGLVVFLFFVHFTAMGQSATIKDIVVIWKTYQNNQEGIIFDVVFDVSGMKGNSGIVAIYFNDSNGNKLYTSEKQFSTSDGQLVVSRGYMPSYDNTSYNEFKIFMPYGSMHNAQIGSRTINVDVVIWGANNNILAQHTSNPFLFIDVSSICICGTGTCSICLGKGVAYGMTCQGCYGSGICRSCHGQGFIISCTCSPMPDPNISPSPYLVNPNENNNNSMGRKCPNCQGTSICNVCKGKGWYNNEHANGKAFDCFECKGNGKCVVCRGKGYFK